MISTWQPLNRPLAEDCLSLHLLTWPGLPNPRSPTFLTLTLGLSHMGVKCTQSRGLHKRKCQKLLKHMPAKTQGPGKNRKQPRLFSDPPPPTPSTTTASALPYSATDLVFVTPMLWMLSGAEMSEDNERLKHCMSLQCIIKCDNDFICADV